MPYYAKPVPSRKADLKSLHNDAVKALNASTDEEELFSAPRGNARERELVESIVQAMHPNQEVESNLTISEFLRNLQIKTAEPGTFDYRAVVAMTENADGPAHFGAFSVRRETEDPGSPASVLYVEPAMLDPEQVAPEAPAFALSDFAGAVASGYRRLFRELLPEYFKEESAKPRFTVVFSGVQKSPWDCMIFSLSFARKMTPARVSRFHREAMGRNESVFHYFDSDFILDPVFYKHTSSSTVAAKKNQESGFPVINKKGENLESRRDRFLITRTIKNEPKKFSNSIEHKRIIFLERALRAE